MKKILLVLILTTIPAYAENDEFGVPYCMSKTDYDCRVKNADYLKWYNETPEGVNYTIKGNKTGKIYTFVFDLPYQSKELFFYNAKHDLQELINDMEGEDEYYKNKKFEQKEQNFPTPTKEDCARLHQINWESGRYTRENYTHWKNYIPDILFTK